MIMLKKIVKGVLKMILVLKMLYVNVWGKKRLWYVNNKFRVFFVIDFNFIC